MRLRELLEPLRSSLGPPPEPPALAPAGSVLIRAEELGIDLGGRRVVDGVDLVVEAGELVALVGPNGAGKSTLLHGLTGDLPTAQGRVLVGERLVSAWSDRDLALRRAVLPQQVAVSFPFTVEEVVRMGRAAWAGTEREADDDEQVALALALADVAHLARRSVPSLSGGERARVALARVLAQSTQLVLLDEPTAALDVHHQELTLTVVHERVRAGGAAVVVLHDLGQAARYADRIAVLAGGTVVADGPPEVVLDAELLSSVYQHPIEVLAHPRGRGLLVVPA